MTAIELIKVAVVGGVMFRTVPPIPIAAFGDQEFFVSEPLLVLTRRTVLARVEVASLGEVVPGEVILRGSDPNIEIGVDPRPRHQRWQSDGIRASSDGFGDGERLNLRIGCNCAVEPPEKLTSGFGKMLPSVFAVENNRHNRVASAG